MPNIVLLPDWEAAPEGLIGKVRDPDAALPGSWALTKEEIDNLEAFAFPTPFAWAEMMALVIRQNLYGHPLFQYYERLCFGVALGLLEVELNDLRAPASGEMGRVLAGSDERYRYFGLLRGTGRERDLKGKVFGATSPETLFWPASRLTKDAEGDWQALDNAIRATGHRDKAYLLLADLRSLMRGQNMWNPDDVLWMRALQHIISRGNQQPSDNYNIYHAHSRSVGPVLVSITKNTPRPFYFPTYQENFAADLMQALTGSFQGPENGAIAILDERGVPHFEVALPSVPPDDTILAGAGTVRVLSAPGMIKDFAATRIRFTELLPLLQPLDEALGRDHSLYKSFDHNSVRDPQEVTLHPFFFPDIVRIPIARLGEAGIRNSDVSFSDRAFELARHLDSPGLPLASFMDNKPAAEIGFRLSYRDQQGRSRRALYIEEYRGHKINDLRALGWVLWSVFTGGAQPAAGAINDQSLTTIMTDGEGMRPFAVTDKAYETVAAAPAPEDRRLATLQRFIKAYKEQGTGTSATDEAKLCYAAALSFARWVFSDQPAIIENGHKARLQEFETSGLKVKLAFDN